MRRLLILLLMLLTVSSCATTSSQPRLAPVHGVVIETLQGAVNVSLTSAAGKMGGNGVLFYRQPESFRLTILAPFGQTLFDIIVNGDKVLYLMESSRKGWQGRVSELPEGLGMRVWPLLKWVVEPPHPAGPALQRSFTRADGSVELVYYDAAGFVQRKVNAAGDEVAYSDYRIVEGVAVPNEIEIRTATGSRLKLTFDEPDINRSIDDDIFQPRLDRYEILPFADFKGF